MFSEKWHYRFMEVARLIATWSKDPNTKTGAIVVGPDPGKSVPPVITDWCAASTTTFRNGWSARPNTIFSNTRKETRFTTRV